MDTTIALAVGLSLSIIAMVILLIKHANLRDEKEKEISEKDTLLSDFISGKESLIKDNMRDKEYISELKNHLAAEHESSKKLREIIGVKTKSETSLKRKVEVLEEENRYLIEHGPKILKLQVNDTEFSKIIDESDKTILKPKQTSWEKRLLNEQGEIKEFHMVEIRNGSRKGYKTAQSIINHIELSQREDAKDKKEYFHIHLGERLN